MKKIIALIIVIGLAGCETPKNREITNYEGEKILVGEINWDGLNTDPYGSWFGPNYMNYTVDSATLESLPTSLKGIDIIMFMGTWCEDSEVQVPDFYKILDFLKFDLADLKAYGLERTEDYELVSPDKKEKEYSISHVPTFIFLRDGKELGRITEYPEKTLEKDMAAIILSAVPN